MQPFRGKRAVTSVIYPDLPLGSEDSTILTVATAKFESAKPFASLHESAMVKRPSVNLIHIGHAVSIRIGYPVADVDTLERLLRDRSEVMAIGYRLIAAIILFSSLQPLTLRFAAGRAADFISTNCSIFGQLN